MEIDMYNIRYQYRGSGDNKQMWIAFYTASKTEEGKKIVVTHGILKFSAAEGEAFLAWAEGKGSVYIK